MKMISQLLSILVLLSTAIHASPIASSIKDLNEAVHSLNFTHPKGELLPRYEDGAVVSTDIPTKVYNQFYRAANLTAVSYCADPPYFIDVYVGPTLNCALEFCTENSNDYSILKVFYPEVQVDLDDNNSYNITATGYVAVSEVNKELLIVYRGTLSITDALKDAELILEDYTPINGGNTACEDCKVHQGFMDLFKSTYDEIFPLVIQELQEHPDYSITVTGHSLGGALTNLALIELKLLGYNPLVISLAGPKIGNQELSDYVDELCGTEELDEKYQAGEIEELTEGFWRVIAKDDYVPLVPPGKVYTHAGLEFKLLDSSPLPQPIDKVVYTGKYVYSSVLEGFGWSLINIVDWLHVYEHLRYFYLQDTCLEQEVKKVFQS
ncbi:putative lipase [Saccharomycopsis crataegensis]|uniref:triacylglycerol lipase n=1 Tax=Saccharomycopsis crataegensis TaxID=43959 RepID=A0AAV5QQG2_9ASCO|nr:putative lipase [Saccharomycopsis crataegensis]